MQFMSIFHYQARSCSTILGFASEFFATIRILLCPMFYAVNLSSYAYLVLEIPACNRPLFQFG